MVWLLWENSQFMGRTPNYEMCQQSPIGHVCATRQTQADSCLFRNVKDTHPKDSKSSIWTADKLNRSAYACCGLGSLVYYRYDGSFEWKLLYELQSEKLRWQVRVSANSSRTNSQTA